LPRRLTRAHQSEFAASSEKAAIKDILRVLAEGGLLDRRRAPWVQQHAWVPLRSRPSGISDRDDAHLSIILALTLGHAALLKLYKWSEGSFVHF
jgi:hypothetical protein